jgi:hypothetical protein
MAYDINDITELIRYHLVASAVDDAAADRNLAQLTGNVEQMMTTRPQHFVEWIVCDDCGASVCTELIDPDGAGWTDDGGFNCSSCRFAPDES